MLRPAFFVLLGLAALKPSLCSKVASEAGSHVDDVPAPKPKLDEPNVKPPAEPSKPPEPADAEEPADAGLAIEAAAEVLPGDDADEQCVKDCVQRNQMRAVSAEMIEQDCRSQCASK